MSFASQLDAMLTLHRKGMGALAVGVHTLPSHLDKQIGLPKLEARWLAIDSLTEEQVPYASDCSAGT